MNIFKWNYFNGLKVETFVKKKFKEHSNSVVNVEEEVLLLPQ